MGCPKCKKDLIFESRMKRPLDMIMINMRCINCPEDYHFVFAERDEMYHTKTMSAELSKEVI